MTKIQKNIVTLCLLQCLLIIFSTWAIGEDDAQAVKDQIWLSGRVIWPGNDLAHASVEVFKDPQFKDLYTRALLLDPSGEYAINIESPGTYYIVTFVDYNDNTLFDKGDAMGIYGIIDWADSRQKPKPLNLEKGQKLKDIDIPITAVVDSQGKVSSLGTVNSKPTAGISGKVIWPDHKTSNAIIFAYTDPTWNNRIGQTIAGEDGKYEISVPSGRYYLIAVMDENKSNLLDAGDKFGIWGMTRFGTFPRPIKVEKDQMTGNRNILIIGQMGISGKALPLQSISDDTQKNDNSISKIDVSGKVLWPGKSIKSALIQAYGDPSMTIATGQAKADANGMFKMSLPYGEYYIVATVDADGDGKYTAGDGIGSYGSKNAAEDMPKKLIVAEDTKNAKIDLVITAEFDSSGQLSPISTADSITITPEPQISEMPTETPNPEMGIPSELQGVTGRIIWEGLEISKAILIFSQNPEFKDGIRVPLQLDENGKYKCSASPGDYYIMAVVDLNSNDLVDSGDGIGTYGTGYWGEPQKATVIEKYITPYININITSVFGPNGEISPIQTPAVARFRYGDPDKITSDNTGDKEIQEWWYWEKGLSFTFEKGEAGWNLTKTDEFAPMADSSKDVLTTGEESPDGIIYYTFDRSVWAINADGKKRRWIAQGTYPTTNADGTKMLLVDTNGNIYLIEPKNSEPGKLVVSRRKTGFQPAISNNGKAAAFTHQIDDYRQIVLENLGTSEESSLPIDSMNSHYPAWSYDDTLIAFSASLSGTDDHNRDIFYYDISNKKLERLSIDPLDEFNPAWSPLNNRFLVFCRTEGEHSQIWMINIDDNGKTVEQQLTKFGGRNPCWSPRGDKIIYENNSQLWTINPDGSGEVPILINEEPIPGQDPFWTR